MRKSLYLFMALASAMPLLAQPVITSQPANQSVIWDGSATFGVTATGTGPLTYQWQLNGTNLPNNIIATIAGSQLVDGQAATNTILASPSEVVADAAGNLFIADTHNNVIRRVDTNGVMKIIAGTGVGGLAGDGGPATNACLSVPVAVALDTNGNLYYTDGGSSRIRKVDTNGVITTVAGVIGGSTFPHLSSGVATNFVLFSPFGIALDTHGNFYIADTANSCIRKVDASGNLTTVAGIPGLGGYTGDNFRATSSDLNYPEDVAVDASGNLYIADSVNNRIRKVTASTGIISTIAGTGVAGYSGDGGSAVTAKVNEPIGVSVDAGGNVYVADYDNHCIRKITNGIITTVAGNGTLGFSGDGGPATNASLALPVSANFDKLGNLYIADASQRIRKVDTNGVITTIAGRNLDDGDPASVATLSAPQGVTQDGAGNFYIADIDNHRIRKIDTNGVISTYAGNGFPVYAGDGGLATNASLRFPCGVALDSTGDLFISDQGNNRIRKVGTNGIITTVAGNGSFSFSGDGMAATNAGLNSPGGLIVDEAGNIYVADTLNNRVRKVDTNGIITTVAGNGAVSTSGNGGQATNAGILSPTSVVRDAFGNLFITSSPGYCIRKVDTNGIISTVAGNGTSGDSGDGGNATGAQFKYPYGIVLDCAGNLFISDSGSGRIRKVGTNGTITTIAGNGVQGAPVDAPFTSLDNPRGMVLDKNGDLYVVDSGVNRLRKLSYLDYADQSGFTVSGVTTNATGNNYSVVITSASGSVTSSVASINLQLPPVVPVVYGDGHTLGFTWNAVSNLTYQFQFTTNLASPGWQNLGSPITATNNTASTYDIRGADVQRFYRVQLVQ